MPCFTVKCVGCLGWSPPEHSLPEGSLKGGGPGQQLPAGTTRCGSTDPSPVASGCSAMLLLTSEATDCTSSSRDELRGSYTLNLTQSCLPWAHVLVTARAVCGQMRVMTGGN